MVNAAVAQSIARLTTLLMELVTERNICTEYPGHARAVLNTKGMIRSGRSKKVFLA